jgi:hypothetical protein
MPAYTPGKKQGPKPKKTLSKAAKDAQSFIVAAMQKAKGN